MVSLVGCTAGPTGPYEYSAPSVAVHVRFADVPVGEAVYGALDAEYLTNSNDYRPSDPPRMLEGSLIANTSGVSASAPLNAGVAKFELVSIAHGNEVQYEVQLFSVRASLSSGIGHWAQPNLLLVYAFRQTSWHLFGPGGPAVNLPQGYSWLERSCGAVPGQIQMEVLPVDATVDFRQVDSTSGNDIYIDVSPDGVYTSVSASERSEQTFVASCGASTTAAGLGTRIAYERAQSPVWAPDNASLYYLSLANENDPTGTVSLRQLRIADRLATELAVVAHGASLQIDNTGTLYVSNGTNLLRVSVVAGSPATLETLPIPAAAIVSPDGRWARYYDYKTNAAHIWDLASATEVGTLPGNVLGWSPDSQIVSWSSADSAPTALNVQSPAALTSAPTSYAYSFSFPVTPNNVSVTWDSGGPYVVSQSADWPEDVSMSCGGCFGRFGLSILNLTTGTSRTAIDPSAGLTAFVPTAPVWGFLFVTATNCLGLLRTSCSTSLLRVSLADATAQTIVSPFANLSLGVSSDGRHVALAAEDGIYVKDLP
jgi:hypothetical protein